MFFNLCREVDQHFPCHDKIGDLWLNHDLGWSMKDSEWRKGYPGNYCEFVENNGQIELKHDRYRSFPLWYDHDIHSLTNLRPSGRQIWADSLVALTSDNIYHQYLDISTDFNFDVETDIDTVIESIQKNFKHVVHEAYHLPKKIFLSGGLDTLTCMALARHVDDIDLIDYLHFDTDSFTATNLIDIRSRFWGYKQIHHWRDPTAIITGACGDEYLMRGPRTVALWSAWHDFDMISYLRGRSNVYMAGYYLYYKNQQVFLDEWQQRHALRDKYPTRKDLMYHLLDILANDHQHWHLGKTITLTPFRDLNLAFLVLCLPFDSLLSQIIDGQLQKEILRRFWPETEQILSSVKNWRTKLNLRHMNDVRLTRKGRSRIL